MRKVFFYKIICFIFVSLSLSLSLRTQHLLSQPLAAEPPQQSNANAVISGWDKLKLGITYEQALLEISNTQHPWINLKDRQANTFSAKQDKSIIELFPNLYLIEGFCYFKNNQLYLIHFVLSKKYFSFLSVLKKLIAKYGNPSTTKHAMVEWEQSSFRLQLYRNGSLRYLNRDLLSVQKENNSSNNNPTTDDKRQVEEKTVEQLLNTL